jgi:hypothetical protein
MPESTLVGSPENVRALESQPRKQELAAPAAAYDMKEE